MGDEGSQMIGLELELRPDYEHGQTHTWTNTHKHTGEAV